MPKLIIMVVSPVLRSYATTFVSTIAFLNYFRDLIQPTSALTMDREACERIDAVEKRLISFAFHDARFISTG